MSADDQTFLDTLSSVPNDIKRYSGDVADYVDKHLEKVSNVIREALSSQEWLPASTRPRPPPPPPKAVDSVSASTLNRIYDWALNNKILTGAIVLATGGVIYHVVKRKSGRKKRRAKRAGNGARLEVVVIAGSPSEPITRSISLDLERRGFIVYVVCNTVEEEVLVQNESRPDIKPLMIDIVDPQSAEESIERFKAHLQTSHHAFQGARSHHLTLRSLIIIPAQAYPSAPLATLTPSTLADLLNTRLLTPILTLGTFLPLLHSCPFPQLHSAQPQLQHKPSVLLLTPGIIPSLTPAFHLPESAVTSALTASANVLSAELAPLGISVTHLQLGSFDLSSFMPHSRIGQNPTISAQRAETLTWNSSSRQAYAKNYVAVTSRGTGFGKGSSLRELNDAVFDAMVRERGGIVRVGVGMGLYAFVGRWVPRTVVGWMMGLRRNERTREGDVEFGRLITDGSEVGSRSVSPESNSSGRVFGLGLGESEFVSVHGEKE